MSVRCTCGVGRRPLEVGEHEKRLRFAAVLCVLLVSAVDVDAARAQSSPDGEPRAQPTAALLATSGTSGAAGDAGLDSVVQAALEKLGVVKLIARPGMDLEAIQLALDCVGQTPSCLRAAAAQAGVEILVAPGLEHSGKELVVTLLYFDARGDGELRHVVRRQSGSTVDQATLDAVPDMLRELFQVAKPAEAPAQGAVPPPSDETGEGPRTGRGVPVAPLILGGAGVLIVVGGIVSGVLMEGTQNDFTSFPVTDKTTKQQALDKASKGKTEATVANVLYGVGAAAIAAGAIWLALEVTQREQESPPQTALVPVLGPGQMGLALVHRGGTL